MSARLLIWEEKNYLLAPVRRLTCSRMPIHHVRTADDAITFFDGFPCSVLFVHWTANQTQNILSVLSHLQRNVPEACSLVIAERRLALYGGIAYRLGATHFAVSNRDLRLCIETAQRHLRQHETEQTIRGNA